jgi:hypothetical protein
MLKNDFLPDTKFSLSEVSEPFQTILRNLNHFYLQDEKYSKKLINTSLIQAIHNAARKSGCTFYYSRGSFIVVHQDFVFRLFDHEFSNFISLCLLKLRLTPMLSFNGRFKGSLIRQAKKDLVPPILAINAFIEHSKVIHRYPNLKKLSCKQ